MAAVYQAQPGGATQGSGPWQYELPDPPHQLYQDPVYNEVKHRYTKVVPRPRKAWIIFVGLSNALNFVLIVVALVRPTPNFSTTVLFRLRTAEKASLTKRNKRNLVTDKGQPACGGINCQARGIALQNGVHSRTTTSSDPLVTVTQYMHLIRPAIASTWISQTSNCEFVLAKHIQAHETSTPIILKSLAERAITGQTTIFTTTTATKTFRPSPHSSQTRTKTKKPTTSSSRVAAPTGMVTFEALYIGPMGICLDQKNTFRICTGASLRPSFSSTYNLSTLPREVIDQLPTDVNGGAILLLLALLVYVIAVVSFVMAYTPATRARTEEGQRAYRSSRYVYWLGLATLANTAGVVLVMSCLLVFKKVFQSALDTIPSMPYELFPDGGGATGPLYISCVFGIISILIGVFILVDDLKLMVTENAQAHSRKMAKTAKQFRLQARGMRRSSQRRPGHQVDNHVEHAKADAEAGQRERGRSRSILSILRRRPASIPRNAEGDTATVLQGGGPDASATAAAATRESDTRSTVPSRATGADANPQTMQNVTFPASAAVPIGQDSEAMPITFLEYINRQVSQPRTSGTTRYSQAVNM